VEMSSPQPLPLILNLDSPQATLEQVGGKGASLARMAAAGLPVPPGFQSPPPRTSATWSVANNKTKSGIFESSYEACSPPANVTSNAPVVLCMRPTTVSNFPSARTGE